jgi:hypothetical protein
MRAQHERNVRIKPISILIYPTFSATSWQYLFRNFFPIEDFPLQTDATSQESFSISLQSEIEFLI